MLQLVFIAILLFPSQLIKSTAINRLFVWDVGQGQWATIVNNNSCYHFDAGGERSAIQNVTKVCGKLKNTIFLSHGDWDHINRIVDFKRKSLNYCIFNYPQEKLNHIKRKYLKKFKFCSLKTIPQPLRKINTPFSICKDKRSANCFSNVFEWANKILLPGDSPNYMERQWMNDINDQIEILLLAHHGSKNSTTTSLLQKLNQLNMAICSARKNKYGHPALRIHNLLKQYKIPLLRTEEWGNIIIEL